MLSTEIERIIQIFKFLQRYSSYKLQERSQETLPMLPPSPLPYKSIVCWQRKSGQTLCNLSVALCKNSFKGNLNNFKTIQSQTIDFCKDSNFLLSTMSQMKPKFPKNNLELKRHCSTKLFEEMCDLLFEIAAKDDDVQRTKSRYLNQHISQWIQTNEDIHSKDPMDISNSTSRPHTHTVQRDCYCCALPLTPGHMDRCKGLLATCRHCNTKGHVKAACGKLGYFPGSHYKA